MSMASNSAPQAEAFITKSSGPAANYLTETNFPGLVAPSSGEVSSRPGVELALGLYLICHVAAVLLIPSRLWTLLASAGRRCTRFITSVSPLRRRRGGTPPTSPVNPTPTNYDKQ